MTRQEWIDRYVAAMRAGNSAYPDDQLRAMAESECDATESTGDINPDEWESPEVIAQEHLENE